MLWFVSLESNPNMIVQKFPTLRTASLGVIALAAGTVGLK